MTTFTCQDCKKVFPKYHTNTIRCRACNIVFRREHPENHPMWKGGKSETVNGYITVAVIGKKTRSLEHRVIMEKHLGRALLATEQVHHINGDGTDNRIENLVLCQSMKEHKRHHVLARGTDKCKYPGCDKGPGRYRGWCWKHYLRWRRTGSPDIVRPSPKGELHGMHKITMEQAREIRRIGPELKKGMPRGYRLVLSKQFGLKPEYVAQVLSGKTWKE